MIIINGGIGVECPIRTVIQSYSSRQIPQHLWQQSAKRFQKLKFQNSVLSVTIDKVQQDRKPQS